MTSCPRWPRRPGPSSASSACTDLAAIQLVLIGALAVASGHLALTNGRRGSSTGAGQRPTAPVEADEREQPMFDCNDLAGCHSFPMMLTAAIWSLVTLTLVYAVGSRGYVACRELRWRWLPSPCQRLRCSRPRRGMSLAGLSRGARRWRWRTSCCGARRSGSRARTIGCGPGSRSWRGVGGGAPGGEAQAAPFSRGEPKSEPRRPGRRSGDEHGRHGHREPLGEVDEELDAPHGPRCECGGEIEHDRTEYQYQDELPEPRRVRRRFAVHIGKCRCCGRRHQGRHPFQTSDALGAAACMLGPRAVALATELNKELGLSPQKTAKALARFGIGVTAGGVVQAIPRQARALEPTYQALIEGTRASRAVAPDETGWRDRWPEGVAVGVCRRERHRLSDRPGRGYEHRPSPRR